MIDKKIREMNRHKNITINNIRTLFERSHFRRQIYTSKIKDDLIILLIHLLIKTVINYYGTFWRYINKFVSPQTLKQE